MMSSSPPPLPPIQTPLGLRLRSLLLSSIVAPISLTIALTAPPPPPLELSLGAHAHAIPYPAAMAPPLPLSSTPYSDSQKLQIGLDNGKIRPCPGTNPGCVSTNPRSASFAPPLLIPDSSVGKAVQALRDAILKTQRNVNFKVDEDTPYGHYLQVEMEGGFGRDVMEFVVKSDAGVVGYRSMATKVTYVYPFTTAVGDSRGQKERINSIARELGWYAPDIESMDSD